MLIGSTRAAGGQGGIRKGGMGLPWSGRSLWSACGLPPLWDREPWRRGGGLLSGGDFWSGGGHLSKLRLGKRRRVSAVQSGRRPASKVSWAGGGTQGCRHFRPGNRAKSVSRLIQVAWCSMAKAANQASAANFPLAWAERQSEAKIGQCPVPSWNRCTVRWASRRSPKSRASSSRDGIPPMNRGIHMSRHTTRITPVKLQP